MEVLIYSFSVLIIYTIYMNWGLIKKFFSKTKEIEKQTK